MYIVLKKLLFVLTILFCSELFCALLERKVTHCSSFSTDEKKAIDALSELNKSTAMNTPFNTVVVGSAIPTNLPEILMLNADPVLPIANLANLVTNTDTRDDSLVTPQTYASIPPPGAITLPVNNPSLTPQSYASIPAPGANPPSIKAKNSNIQEQLNPEQLPVLNLPSPHPESYWDDTD